MAVFFSDISGAFDRVRTERLLEKCRRAGVGETLLAFLQSYLRPRSAQVVVNGAFSEPLTLENEVFQGTVLGPPLWNTFFPTWTKPLAQLEPQLSSLQTT